MNSQQTEKLLSYGGQAMNTVDLKQKGVPAVAQQDWWCLWSAGTEVQGIFLIFSFSSLLSFI